MPDAFVPLASASSPFEAKLLAARLGSEGILWQLRGEVDGMYPLGGVEVLVEAGDLGRAREVLAGVGDDEASAPDPAWDDEDDGHLGPRTLPGARRAWVPVLLLALLVLVACTRVLQSLVG